MRHKRRRLCSSARVRLSWAAVRPPLSAPAARLRLAPQSGWAVNEPDKLSSALKALEAVAAAFNGKGGTQVSLADTIVLGGCAAIESAAKAAGMDAISVPFTPGRGDATAEQTDAESFSVLEPHTDGFRNFVGAAPPHSPQAMGASAEALLIEKARMLCLTKAEMAVLVGGMRVLGANHGGSALGVFTKAVGTLTNDFFVNLVDMALSWKASTTEEGVFEGKDRTSGALVWTASRVDLVFGSNSELRAIAEYYACDDAREAFVRDFVDAWAKVMDLDRCDAHGPHSLTSKL